MRQTIMILKILGALDLLKLGLNQNVTFENQKP